MALGQNGRSNEFLFPLHHFLSSQEVCVFVCVCVCMYMYIHIMYTRAHTHIHIITTFSLPSTPHKNALLSAREIQSLNPTPYALRPTHSISLLNIVLNHHLTPACTVMWSFATCGVKRGLQHPALYEEGKLLFSGRQTSRKSVLL